MIKLSLVILPICTSALFTMQFLMAPILASKKTNVDEFMVENQRTRMRQNYILRRALKNDIDNNKMGVTYIKEAFDPNTNSELPALIVDYADMIRNDIILLDNSIETRTRKRGNIELKKYDHSEGIKDVSCTCEDEMREPKILGSDYFPRSVETRSCNENLCQSPYKCQERLHNITVLKRKRSFDEVSPEEITEDLGKRWVAIKLPVIVGCDKINGSLVKRICLAIQGNRASILRTIPRGYD